VIGPESPHTDLGAGATGRLADAGSDAAASSPVDASTSADAGSTNAAPDASASSDASSSDAGFSTCGGADPCSCATFNAHPYRLCSAFLNFATAEADCEAHGMKLARIDDAQEDAFLDQAFSDVFSGLTFAFIGASDQAQEGTWRWLEGDVAFWNGDSGGSALAGLYTHWDVNKPFGNTTRNCAGLLTNGSWEDRSCTAQNAYICEGL
jgi:hypothetical protein